MSLTTGEPSVGGLAAGLITAVVETASPGLAEKAATVATGTVETLVEHNPTLEPVASALVTYGEQLATSHGYGFVASLFQELTGIFATAPSAVVVAVPPKAA